MQTPENTVSSTVTRRDFIKYSGVVIIAVGGARLCVGTAQAGSIPESRGYLVIDTKKCQGCLTCMLACSLAHEGEANLSLARIQVQQNPFGTYPGDISMQQCRQCIDPVCVAVCPTGALHVDAENGNARVIDPETCNGCQTCMQACPFQPESTIWNFITGHMQKCDLCAATPHWHEQGGVDGKQACVQMCPVQAIEFREKIYFDRYTVNLRDHNWIALGYARF